MLWNRNAQFTFLYMENYLISGLLLPKNVPKIFFGGCGDDDGCPDSVRGAINLAEEYRNIRIIFAQRNGMC